MMSEWACEKIVEQVRDEAYKKGYSDGINKSHVINTESYRAGYYKGQREGYHEGHDDGYWDGYHQGYKDCENGNAMQTFSEDDDD